MLDDELLAPDFDPTTLTIPQLKAALTAVGVTLPLRQERKTVYVELFQRHISAKAERLRREKRAVRPSAEGIMAVSGSGSPRYEEVLCVREPKRCDVCANAYSLCLSYSPSLCPLV